MLRSMRIPSKALFRPLSSTTRKPVCIDYDRLISPTADLSDLIEEAYSPEGLGILTVSNVPNFMEKRERLLPLARKLALLSDEEKAKIEVPECFYAVGWSHGKEKFQGKPDESKGSFYANPELDIPKADMPGYFPNVWPSKAVPDLEAAFKETGREIIRVGALLSKHIDKYVAARVKDYDPNTLQSMIQTSQSHIGRLLHYFPKPPGASDAPWCGWHNDHGALTGLTSSMFLRQDTGEKIGSEAAANPKTGLFIKSRSGEIVKAPLPEDHLGFQIGETAQILSGGILQATPHAVMVSGLPDIGRNTLAVFMEPHPNFKLKVGGTDRERVFVDHEDVPSLRGRLKDPMTFGEFHSATVQAYL